jgi:hypothetical protein
MDENIHLCVEVDTITTRKTRAIYCVIPFNPTLGRFPCVSNKKLRGSNGGA